jgi:hypothetical protein
MRTCYDPLQADRFDEIDATFRIADAQRALLQRNGFTGRPRLMVVIVDGCTGAHAYVGPVSTYHSVLTTELQRLTDAEWQTRMEEATMPPWTSTYRR